MDDLDSDAGFEIEVPVNPNAKHIIVAVFTLDYDASWYRCTCGSGHTALGAAISASPAEDILECVRTHLGVTKFERDYAERSGMTVEELRALGRVVMPCSCGEDACEGWVYVSREAAKDYEPGGVYGPR